MLGHSNCGRLALLLALTSTLLSAQATEISPADRVVTTPGLSPDAVRRAFDRQRQELARCMRLVYLREVKDPSRRPLEHVVWNETPDTDDRVQLRFTLSPEGRVLRDGSRDEHFSVRGLYLDTGCVDDLLMTWSFPPFPGGRDESVQVEVWARFRTTAAERQAALTRMREELTALCGALSALGSPDHPPAQAQWGTVISRFLAERGARMDLRLRRGIEAMARVNVESGFIIYENVVEQSVGTPVECPVVRSWMRQ